jgi:C4-dicarboxylate-specific signal transduction histidine kinase
MVPQLLEQLMQIARTSALEEMASGFAHELNQPIGAIATFAQTGERMLGLPTPMIQETRDILYLISEEALKAGRGIHSIRNLFRGHDTEKTTCNLADVLGELNPVLHFLAERCGARLHIDVKAGLPPTFIDKLRIQHVIFTLVQNALEAPCDPAVARAVEIGVSSDRYTVTTAVRDHGLGVPAHARDQLYRPFFTTKQNGSGLGLASIQAIIEAHEGTVGFNEAEGGGAVFWFTLPVGSGAPSE